MARRSENEHLQPRLAAAVAASEGKGDRMKNTTWGHRVIPINTERIEQMQAWNANPAHDPLLAYCCATKNCQNLPTHYACYGYVTGRTGRTTEAQRQVCYACAAKFAAKHNIKAAII